MLEFVKKQSPQHCAGWILQVGKSYENRNQTIKARSNLTAEVAESAGEPVRCFLKSLVFSRNCSSAQTNLILLCAFLCGLSSAPPAPSAVRLLILVFEP